MTHLTNEDIKEFEEKFSPSYFAKGIGFFSERHGYKQQRDLLQFIDSLIAKKVAEVRERRTTNNEESEKGGCCEKCIGDPARMGTTCWSKYQDCTCHSKK